jgi:hypothetical protein
MCLLALADRQFGEITGRAVIMLAGFGLVSVVVMRSLTSSRRRRDNAEREQRQNESTDSISKPGPPHFNG